jgi:hypothetical protein
MIICCFKSRVISLFILLRLYIQCYTRENLWNDKILKYSKEIIYFHVLIWRCITVAVITVFKWCQKIFSFLPSVNDQETEKSALCSKMGARGKNYKVKKGKIVPVFKQLSTMPWRRKVKWRYISAILDHRSRWRWVVSFTPRLLYLRGKNFRHPLYRAWLGPGISMDNAVKRNIFCPYGK